MSNSSRRNRNRRPTQGTTQVIGTEMAAGYVPPSASLTPRSGRPVGLAPLIAAALDELVPADGGPDGVPIGFTLADAGCVGVRHSSVFNPITQYVYKQVAGLDMVYTTADEIVAERGDVRVRVNLPAYVADFLLTYDTTDAFPALVAPFARAPLMTDGEVWAA